MVAPYTHRHRNGLIWVWGEEMGGDGGDGLSTFLGDGGKGVRDG